MRTSLTVGHPHGTKSSRIFKVLWVSHFLLFQSGRSENAMTQNQISHLLGDEVFLIGFLSQVEELCTFRQLREGTPITSVKWPMGELNTSLNMNVQIICICNIVEVKVAIDYSGTICSTIC